MTHIGYGGQCIGNCLTTVALHYINLLTTVNKSLCRKFSFNK